MCLITSDCGISLLVACSDNVFVYIQVHCTGSQGCLVSHSPGFSATTS